MLYQLAIYALAQDAEAARATILYPSFASAPKDQVVLFNDVSRGATKARVILRPVDLRALAALLRAGATSAALRERQALVQAWTCDPAPEAAAMAPGQMS